MDYKTIEIRDRLTFIPALAMRVSGADGYLFRRGGFGAYPCILLVRLTDCKANYEAYDWADRTMTSAHEWIENNWDVLQDRSVVDVEFIRGEKPTAKISEEMEVPLL